MYFLCKNQDEFEEKKNFYLQEVQETDEKSLVEYILYKKGAPLNCMRILAIQFRARALKNWLLEKDVNNFKQNCYIAGKLNLLHESRSDWGYSGTNIGNFFKILMSDNKDLINYLVRNIDIICYESKPNYYKGMSSNLFLNKTTLLALKGEWEKVKERSKIFLNDIPKDMKKRISDFEFFLGLAEGNTEKMKIALEKLLIPKNAKIATYDTEAYFDFYLQVQVLMYGKIASIHGYDLGIDHELAPKELIKYAPLSEEEYKDPYDFMKEFDYDLPQIEWIKKYSIKEEKNITLNKILEKIKSYL